MKWLVAAALLLSSPALAQSPQMSPSQLAIQITNGVNAMSVMMDRQAEELQHLRARVHELEEKYEKKTPEPNK